MPKTHPFDLYPEHPFLKDKESIIAWLTKYKIQNYIVHDDFTVSTGSKVELNLHTDYIPIQFRETGTFDARGVGLCSLIGSPYRVKGNFMIDKNILTDLTGSPLIVEQSFFASHNCLTSLKGAPLKVGFHFDISNNQLTTLEYMPGTIKGNLICDENPIVDITLFPLTLEPEAYLRFPLNTNIRSCLTDRQLANTTFDNKTLSIQWELIKDTFQRLYEKNKISQEIKPVKQTLANSSSSFKI